MVENAKEYAGFWRRFAAFMIDWVILSYFLNSLYWYIFNQIRLGSDVFNPSDTAVKIIFIPLSIIITWCYYSGMESSPLKATIGKLLLGIFVTDLSGVRISFAKATGRHFGKIISGAIFLIGYILAGFTEKKQALHDMMTDCLVLRK